MRQTLLKILRCPECAAHGLALIGSVRDDGLEVVEGGIICAGCGAVYRIRAGVVDMSVRGNNVIDREVVGNTTKSLERASSYNDAWLTSLPEGFARENEAGKYDHHNFLQVIDSLGIKKEDAVLDLGCGTTWTSNELSKRSCNVIATDISMEKFIGLESARVFIDKYGNYYERVRTDMCRLPFRNGSVDFTVNEASLHHAHALDTSLSEIARVLKKGGKAVFINEPMTYLLDPRKPSERHGFEDRANYGWNENKYTILEYIRAIKKAGLSLERVFYPPSVRQKLMDMASLSKDNRNLKYRLGSILAGPYSKSRLIMKLTERVFFYPMLAMGIPLCAIAVKR